MQDIQLGLGHRNVFSVNHALPFEPLRQMRVVIYGEAVGAHFYGLVEGRIKAVNGLMWQPIDEVKRNRFEADRSRSIDQGNNFACCLDAVDGLLHLGVEVLNAQTKAVKAQLTEQANAVTVHSTRVDLDRKLATIAIIEIKRAAELLH